MTAATCTDEHRLICEFVFLATIIRCFATNRTLNFQRMIARVNSNCKDTKWNGNRYGDESMVNDSEKSKFFRRKTVDVDALNSTEIRAKFNQWIKRVRYVRNTRRFWMLEWLSVVRWPSTSRWSWHWPPFANRLTPNKTNMHV